jgi:hypothetical protein
MQENKTISAESQMIYKLLDEITEAYTIVDTSNHKIVPHVRVLNDIMACTCHTGFHQVRVGVLVEVTFLDEYLNKKNICIQRYYRDF